MDIAFIENNILEKKENMNKNTKATEQSNRIGISPIFSGLSNIILAIVAVYLCWTRNTEQNETSGMKIVYCIIAFYFPLIYIIYYAATRK